MQHPSEAVNVESFGFPSYFCQASACYALQTNESYGLLAGDAFVSNECLSFVSMAILGRVTLVQVSRSSPKLHDELVMCEGSCTGFIHDKGRYNLQKLFPLFFAVILVFAAEALHSWWSHLFLNELRRRVSSNSLHE